MNFPETIKGMEDALKQAGQSVDALCDRASVARSTWTRWKAGAVKPNMDTWLRVKAEHDALTGADTAGA